jgi:hypothetical protein
LINYSIFNGEYVDPYLCPVALPRLGREHLHGNGGRVGSRVERRSSARLIENSRRWSSSDQVLEVAWYPIRYLPGRYPLSGEWWGVISRGPDPKFCPLIPLPALCLSRCELETRSRADPGRRSLGSSRRSSMMSVPSRGILPRSLVPRTCRWCVTSYSRMIRRLQVEVADWFQVNITCRVLSRPSVNDLPTM